MTNEAAFEAWDEPDITACLLDATLHAARTRLTSRVETPRTLACT
jgi:hypothetical protein